MSADTLPKSFFSSQYLPYINISRDKHGDLSRQNSGLEDDANGTEAEQDRHFFTTFEVGYPRRAGDGKYDLFKCVQDPGVNLEPIVPNFLSYFSILVIKCECLL